MTDRQLKRLRNLLLRIASDATDIAGNLQSSSEPDGLGDDMDELHDNIEHCWDTYNDFRAGREEQ